MRATLAIAVFCWTSTWALGQVSPYAGQQQRDIKALSTQEVADLLAGQGMGLAKAAELNGYPGPAHVIENAEALKLTAHQRQATQRLLDQHKQRARHLGSALVAAEQALDHSFANRNIDVASLARLTSDVGRLQAQLREEHLRTHLEQTDLLTKDQVALYTKLRGYAAPGHPHHRP